MRGAHIIPQVANIINRAVCDSFSVCHDDALLCAATQRGHQLSRTRIIIHEFSRATCATLASPQMRRAGVSKTEALVDATRSRRRRRDAQMCKPMQNNRHDGGAAAYIRCRGIIECRRACCGLSDLHRPRSHACAEFVCAECGV